MKPNKVSVLQEIHRNGAGNSFGEYQPGENAFGPLGAGSSAQPILHNPRKQRKNPAAADLGETFL
jgi:hypothetical protein